MHDARAVVGGDELVGHDPERVAGGRREEVERPLVGAADEVGDRDRTDDLGVGPSTASTRLAASTTSRRAAAGAHPHVLEAGADGDGGVRRQRPRRRRPDEEVEVGVDARGKRT